MSASDVQAPSPAPSAAGRGEAPPVRRSAECDPYLDPNCIGAMDPSRVPIGPSSVQPPSTPSLPQGAVANLGVKGLEHEELTEFQQFASDAVGTLLPIFGRSLFTAVPSTFAPVDGGVAVSSDYVIGPGDELYIQVSGQINFASRVPVDRSGQIYFPKVGTIPVAGVRYGELADYLKSNIGRVFRNFDLAVNLGRLRSIQVLVVGHARRPGSYTISSLSTLTNAIFASGGPSVRGSMRRIQVRRGERMVTELDLYDLLLGGDKTKDVFLQDGDVIFIPSVGPQVAIAGRMLPRWRHRWRRLGD
jgi:protein involved in polysaccharide export with SLBB domain